MRSVVDSIYKVCNGYTWKTSLQVVFALVAFLPQTESAVENQEVANLRVQVVFTDLPEPYLPGIGRAYSLDDLGVEFRPSSHSRDDEEFRDSFHTPPDFGVLSGHDHNRGQLCLTLDQTDLKARRVEENLTSIGLTVVSQDDKQTTSDNRRAELSTSVCAHGSLSNDSYIIAIIQQERKTEAESYVQLRANTFDRRWPHKHLKPDKMAEASFVYTDDDPLVEHFLFSPDCEYILNEQQDNPQNFGASSRTGAAQEDFDEHNGAYASVESEKGVHERRFRYAGHVEQNGHWKLEIENTNQETTHSIQNCATKKNFGASSRTGAAQEDFDEHNGAYASVESEKGVHERRFRYAGHVEQNGHWKLEIENTNQETTHSIQNCATKK
ncbi:uncharacterized protein LOC128552151, partial [Mercenaria mercenaria]|uniref:uncharacterized protein LOC128552151 n=1 Tax=Mercenaria mercenaria TaxID=6596 RepID=UPI00234E66ED